MEAAAFGPLHAQVDGFDASAFGPLPLGFLGFAGLALEEAVEAVDDLLGHSRGLVGELPRHVKHNNINTSKRHHWKLISVSFPTSTSQGVMPRLLIS